MTRFEFRCTNPDCGLQSSIQYSNNADQMTAWCPDCHLLMPWTKDLIMASKRRVWRLVRLNGHGTASSPCPGGCYIFSDADSDYNDDGDYNGDPRGKFHATRAWFWGESARAKTDRHTPPVTPEN